MEHADKQNKGPFALGQKAARGGKEAADCPYEMGRDRRAWLAGYFAAKPPLKGEDEPDEE